MKKLILTLSVCAALFTGVRAQTALDVEITVTHESVRRGPYARYAQSLLGAVAPLSDKENYAIATAAVTPAGPAREAGNTASAAPVESFDGVPADKMSPGEASLETAAAEAAGTLFTLRRRRFDLITGEVGENVYGAGMEASLREMKRLEDEYIALFMGRRTMRTETRTITVVPELGRGTPLIVGRFTETAGLLPDDDLSGRPIVLELTAEEKQTVVYPSARSGRDAEPQTVTAVVAWRYRLVDQSRVLAAGRIPVITE